MSKKIWLSFFIIFLFTVGLINPSWAENFIIQDYGINIDVNKNKKAHVTEEISVYFFNPCHGLIRNIPIVYDVRRSDGTGYKEHSKISNIKVDNKFSVSTNSSYKFIKIGHPKKLVQGNLNYVISYDYQMHDDKMPDNDEFYFNIIGTEWATEIQNSTFSITLPKEFNPEDVGLSVGSYGVSGYKDRAEITVEGNTIKGHITKPLNPNEGITIRVILPQKYFNNVFEIPNIPYEKILGVLGVLILTFFAYINWYKFGKEEHTTTIITFLPPKNLNSAEVGAIFSEEGASLKDVVSLILYLASKGYIKIETEKTGLLNNNFTIKKIKSYDGLKEEEKLLMYSLFKNSDKITKDELRKSQYFYKDCAKIVELLEQKRKKYFVETNFSKYLKMYAFWFGIFIFSILSLINFSSFELQSSINGLFGIFCIIFIFSSLLLLIINFSGKILKYCLGTALFAIIILFPSLLMGLSWDKLTYTIFIFDIACFVITSICFTNMSKRTEEGNNLYQEILGFKHFLQVSEKSRLEILIKENPNYYNDILPYAYILGISEMLIKKFKDLIPITPDWYKGEFSRNNFNSLASGLHSVTYPTTTNGGIKNSSSSGGHSGGCGGGGGFSGGGGGGCSGGGGGGGGGSSW